MGRAEYKVEGGKLVKAKVTMKGNKVQKVKVTGDFFLHPEDLIEELEEALVGSVLDESSLAELIRGVIAKRNAVLLGASPEDLAKCIVMAGKSDG